MCPQHVHTSLKWNEVDPMTISEDDENFSWNRVKEAKAYSRDKNPTMSAADQSKIHQGLKRKQPNTESESSTNKPSDEIRPVKCQRKGRSYNASTVVVGTIWNADTWTCAYDAIITSLSNIFFLNTKKWYETIPVLNPLFGEMVNQWKQVVSTGSIYHLDESVRLVQQVLHRQDSTTFPMERGKGTELTVLIPSLLNAPERPLSVEIKCIACERSSTKKRTSPYWPLRAAPTGNTIAACVKYMLTSADGGICIHCGGRNIM